MAEGLSPVGTKSYAEMRLETNMVRTVSWWHVFFIAAGVPALVLFSMGGIAAITGPVAPLAWTLSMIIGFIDCFIYAEIAGLHPRKSGGTAVHGATAWIRYSQYTAPLSLWCNWVAWSPVLAIGSGLAAGYLLSIFFAPDATINTWQITLFHTDFLEDGRSASTRCSSSAPSSCWPCGTSSTTASCARRASRCSSRWARSSRCSS